MEFVDGRETRRRDKGEDAMSTPPPLPSFVTITTIAISPIPNRSSPPPWLLRSVFTGVATTSVTLVTSLFLSERVNLLSFSPTSWWSQREIVEKMIEMIDSGFDCGNVICARYDKRLKSEMAEKSSGGGVGLMEESMLLSLVLWVLYLGKSLNLLNLSNWLVNTRHGHLPMAMHLIPSLSLSIGLNLIQTRRRRREERYKKKETTELRWEGDCSLEL
ncbi:hypothetical protein F2Q69_00041594 [Brassica cretica]|uniref:Uncharacterized protein n=1 Tax=Brassica cretica TaxID=69181 RepID=A0A8S9N628_BRACR|nr:hypothetical protein F2Q69_00041594 [Brassica cretica]